MPLDIKVDLRGKIANIDLKPNDALLPLYEAIVNSIYEINQRCKYDKNFSIDKGLINVFIQRSYDIKGQRELKIDRSLPPITGFIIEDNGIGFNNQNYEYFNTSDCTHKSNIGGKGLGHFLWLKAFDDVEIDSIFEENDKRYLRHFIFTLDEHNTETGEDIVETTDELKTVIKLRNFKEEYRITTKAYKKSNTIAEKILRHCLSFFINNTAPEIRIIDMSTDGMDDITNLSSLYCEIKDNFKKNSIYIKKYKFDIIHICLYKPEISNHQLVFCGDNRDVKSEILDSELGTSNQFSGIQGKFAYCGYVFSSYLDQYTNNNRNDFNIPMTRKIDLEGRPNLKDDDPSFNEIHEEIVNKEVKPFLESYLNDLKKTKKEMIESYVSKINPSLRIVLPYIDDFIGEINIGMNNEKIAEILYKHKGIIDYNLLKESNKILSKKSKSIIDLNRDIVELLPKLNNFKKSELAGYVLYRYKILELFNKKLEVDKDGHYALEEEIHNLILPKKTTTDELHFGDHNLWILDDKLSFHTYASSDIPLNKFSDSESDKRPDILLFKEDSITNSTIASVTIVELKRPGATYNNILNQIYDYLDGLINRKIKTTTGRTLNTTDQTVYYCYAICDFQKYGSDIHNIAKRNEFKRMRDDLGYYHYHSSYNAHIEFISYDKLLPDARMRNHVWFDKLGLDINRLL